MLLRRPPRPLKAGPSEAGLNTLANAISNGVGPNHGRASRTASVRFEVALQFAFQETFSYAMAVWSLLGEGSVMVRRKKSEMNIA